MRTRISASGSKPFGVGDGESWNGRSRAGSHETKFTVILGKSEHLRGIMAPTQLVTTSQTSSSKNDATRPLSLAIPEPDTSPTSVGSRIHRHEAVTSRRHLPQRSIAVPFSEMARTIAGKAIKHGSDMILIPWLTSGQDAFGGNPHHIQTGFRSTSAPSTPRVPIHNPFELLFKGSNHHGSVPIIHFHSLDFVFAQSTTDVAPFVDQAVLGSR
ncbi:hypothetical protein BKA70DRAFT_835106 [Coprinopsis sp. MPI-PUGE-AT-0042]|nr:hypothetical protein BKA70DRAFT_835106 [Coprinopsis sp. MPI-PUGE-AT-0042]